MCLCLTTTGLDCEIDISKSIQNVRAQRSGMVQTEVGLPFTLVVCRTKCGWKLNSCKNILPLNHLHWNKGCAMSRVHSVKGTPNFIRKRLNRSFC